MSPTPSPLSDYAQRLKLGPELRQISQVWLEKGITLCRLQRFDEALGAFEKSLALFDRSPRAWYNKGLTLASLGRYDEAVVAYDAALKIDAARPFIWLQKGMALAALGRSEEALAALDRALELDPDDALAWRHRGAILFKQARYDEALAAYDRTLALEDDRTVVWKARGPAVKVAVPAEERTLRLRPGWLTVPAATTPDDPSSPSATRPATPLPPQIANGGGPAMSARGAVPAPADTPVAAPAPATEMAAEPSGELTTESSPSPSLVSGAEGPLPSDRPRLAANVELHGQIQDSGFQKAQWLVERDGRFIQLSELLYRVIELCDGQRTVEDIAAGVRSATGRNVSAENVRYLLTTRLIPTHLVADATGAPLPTSPSAPRTARTGWRSPLSISLRFAPLGPRLVNAVAGVFQYFYLPHVLLVMLALALAGQIWLYRVERFDFGSALRQAFAQPSLLLGVLGLSALATLFHEVGHAAALRYGGGRPRRIGVGFYMLMPVFFSDVSDNYRLGRWARIRTDLGGIYFNLLADLAFFAIYNATHQRVLLFAVAATNIEILFNLVPFGRFDGYWALADLTGIPDFFALMGPFLRSLWAFRWWRGPQLPPLKPWVRRIYAVYTLVTVPLLALFFAELFLIVPTNLPHLFLSLGGFAQVLAHAWRLGDRRGVILSGLNLLMLALVIVPLMASLMSLALGGVRLLRALYGRLLARRAAPWVRSAGQETGVR